MARGIGEVGTYHLPEVHKTSATQRHTVACQLRRRVLESGLRSSICFKGEKGRDVQSALTDEQVLSDKSQWFNNSQG